MKKYYVSFNITLPFEMEIEAENGIEAKQIAKEMSHADILQSFAENVLDYSNGDVDVESIMSEDGDYVYDGIGAI